MSKGISATIASLLLVVIVVGLAMSVYFYSSGMLQGITRSSVEFIDAACSIDRGEYYMTIRNTALFDVIRTNEIVITLDAQPANDRLTWDVQAMPANGGLGVGTISGATPGPHRIKIISPISQPQELVAAC